MSFADAKELLLEREMLKLVQEFSGEARQDEKLSQRETNLGGGIPKADGIDWEEELAALMDQNFRGELIGFQSQEDTLGINLEDQQKINASSEQHNREAFSKNGMGEDSRKGEKANNAHDDDECRKEISREYLQTNKWGCKEFKVVYSNGDVFQGETDRETGLKDGWGLYLYANGEKYEGFFQDDVLHGYGRYWFLGGHHYEGDWEDGVKHGIGQLQFSTGDRYSGFFSNDNFHGEGEYYYKNGDTFKGTFKSGKKHGTGKFQSQKGRKIIGEWIENELQKI